MSNRIIGTELKLAGEKEFNQQMKTINASLKTTKSDMAALSSEFADNANSMEALRAKQKLLQDSVEQHKSKVDALTQQYKAAAKQYGENSAMAQKYKQQLNQATVALNKETAALEANADAIKSKWLSALNTLGAGSKKALSGVGSAAAGMGKMVGGAAAASAAGVLAIGAAAGAAFLGMANMAKEAADAAKAAADAGEELTVDQEKWLAFSGQLDALDSSAANAKSAIAGLLLPMLGDLSTEGSAFLNSFLADMAAAAGNTEEQTKILGRYIADGAKLIIEKLPEYVKAGKDILNGVLSGFSESSPELLDMGLDLIMDLLNFILSEAPALAEAGLELVLQLIEGLDGESLVDSAANMVDRLVSGLGAAAPKLIPAAVKLVLELMMGLAKNTPKLLESGWDLIVGILEGISAGLGEIAEMGPEILDALINGLKNSDSKVLNWCGDLIETIIAGISDAWDGLVSWFNDLWDNLFSSREVDVNVNASGSGRIDGSHANGLRYVPFDGYLAQLHRGEAVLAADEAAAYRSGQGNGKVFNMTINTQSVSKSDLDMIVSYVDEKLGG